jgi:hypothetical protein
MIFSGISMFQNLTTLLKMTWMRIKKVHKAVENISDHQKKLVTKRANLQKKFSLPPAPIKLLSITQLSSRHQAVQNQMCQLLAESFFLGSKMSL